MKLFRIFILIAFCTTVAQAVQAQPAATTAKPMLTFNHLALHVHDLKKSTDFYEQVMGFQKIPDPFKDDRHTWFSIGDPFQLHLIQGAPKEIQQDIKRHLCFSVKSMDDFLNHLSQHKVKFHNSVGVPDKVTVRADGVSQIYIQDPDGYWLEINNDTL